MVLVLVLILDGVGIGVEVVRGKVARMFRGDERAVVVVSRVETFVSVRVVVVLGAAGAGRLAPDAADVDQQRLVAAEEECQTLGDRLLADAVPAIDVDERGRGRVHGPAEDIGRRDGGGDGGTAAARCAHWKGLVMARVHGCQPARTVQFGLGVALGEITTRRCSMAVLQKRKTRSRHLASCMLVLIYTRPERHAAVGSASRRRGEPVGSGSGLVEYRIDSRYVREPVERKMGWPDPGRRFGDLGNRGARNKWRGRSRVPQHCVIHCTEHSLLASN